MGSYRLRFVSLRGAEYEVRIYPREEGYVEDGVTELTGAPEPIVTEEESSTDITTAVRSSTGYINIVTDDYALQERLMPTSADEMRVTLVRHAMADETEQEDKVMWEGYVRPETFTQDWCAGPWEIQLPVISHLGKMMDDYLSDGNTGLLTVREWLHRICGDVYKYVMVPDDELMTPGTMPWGSDTLATPTALQLAFSEELFKSPIPLYEREDPNDTERGLWDASTNGEIASSLSVVLRWVFREHGDTLVCSDPSGMCARYQLYDVASLLDESPQPIGSIDTLSVEMEELGKSWADTCLGGDDGTKEVLLPMGKVSVSGGGNEYDLSLLSAGDEDWEKVGGIPMVNGAPSDMNRPDTVPFKLYGDSSATIKSQKVRNNVEYECFRYTSKQITAGGVTYDAGTRMDSASTGKRHLGETSLVYGNCFPYVVFGLNASQMGHGDYFGGGEIAAIHYFYSRNGGYVHHRLNSVILAHLPLNARNWPAVKFRTTLAQLLPYSTRHVGAIVLQLSGQVNRGQYYNNIDMADSCDNTGFYGFQCSIKIGKYYIYKDTWGSHKCTLTQTESPFDVLWTKDNNDGFTENVKLSINNGCPMSLDDTVEVTIYTPSNAERDPSQTLANNCKYLRISNFAISVKQYELPDSYDTRETLLDEPSSTIEKSITLSGNKTQEISLQTAFGGTDNPGALLNAIPATIGGVTSSMMQTRKVGVLEGANDGARYLCMRTLDWLRKQGESTRYALKVPLTLERPWSLQPEMLISEGDNSYYLAGVTRHWRDDTGDVRLIEIKA
jgi:hypothetical protein